MKISLASKSKNLKIPLISWDLKKKVMTRKNKSNILPNKDSESSKRINFPGYQPYPVNEDIYNHDKEEQDIDPENITKLKSNNQKVGTRNEKDFEEDMSGDDLDVPGSDLDDEQEIVGSEDEENNYYSLGGDNHNDLEDNG